MDKEYAVTGGLKVDLPDNPHLKEMELAGIRCFTEIACNFEASKLLLSGDVVHIDMAEYESCKSFAITFRSGCSFEFDITSGKFMIVQNNGCEFSVANGALVVGQPRAQRSLERAA